MREAIRQARYSIQDSFRLIRKDFFATASVALLVMLPGLATVLSGYSFTGEIYAAWDAFLQGSGEYGLTALALATAQYAGEIGLSGGILSLLFSLFATPLLLGALALIYLSRLEGALYVPPSQGGSFAGQGPVWTLRKALRQARLRFRDLLLVAVASLFASYMIELLPRLLAGLLSALARLFSLIPFVGVVLMPAAMALMLLVDGAAAYAVIVLLSYVWQVAMNEGIGGFGALARSYMLVRLDFKRTAVAFGIATLVRWIGELLVLALWYVGYRAAGVLVLTLPLLWKGLDGLCVVWNAAIAAALFASHPNREGNGPGDVRRMKSANID